MTGHIRQRSPGSWELRFTVEGKTRTATIRGTRREAEKELRKRLVSLDDGGVVDPTKLTTGQWFDQWLAIVRPEISPATYDHYQRAAKTHLKPRLGNVPLAKLSRARSKFSATWPKAAGRTASSVRWHRPLESRFTRC